LPFALPFALTKAVVANAKAARTTACSAPRDSRIGNFKFNLAGLCADAGLDITDADVEGDVDGGTDIPDVDAALDGGADITPDLGESPLNVDILAVEALTDGSPPLFP
jgi:hypothetical protein